jgi:predicted phosphoribosyltransferase
MANLFRDRTDTGWQLADALREYANRSDVIVLALPRGGVPIGFVVAQELNVLLDILLVRKLGVPGQEELAMGAIATGGVRILNDELIWRMRIPSELVSAITAQEVRELEWRERLYRHGRPAPDLRGRTVILVDDGMAMGASMTAAVAAVRHQDPALVIVAAPVASPHAVETLRKSADELVCLAQPKAFFSVGQWYDEFGQVSDQQVQDLLEQASFSQMEVQQAVSEQRSSISN